MYQQKVCKCKYIQYLSYLTQVRSTASWQGAACDVLDGGKGQAGRSLVGRAKVALSGHVRHSHILLPVLTPFIPPLCKEKGVKEREGRILQNVNGR
jgi:hypothetical protein